MNLIDYDQLMHDYGKELMKKIDLVFRSYELDFHWISNYADDDDPIYIYREGMARFSIIGYNKDIQPNIEDGDFIAFKALVTEVVDNFMGEYSQKPPYDQLDLFVDDIVVYKDTLDGYFWDHDLVSGSEMVEAITIDIIFKSE